MNKSQEQAIKSFRFFMERQLNKNPEYGDEIVAFEVKPTDYGTGWIKAETCMTKLSEGNLLRALERQYWFVSVGKRGALDVKMAPASFHQFNGKRAFNMHFDVR